MPDLEETIRRLKAYSEAGATDLRINVAAHNEKSRQATYDALANYMS